MYLACSSHKAKEMYELSLEMGEEVAVLGKMDGELVKAKSQLTQSVGYLASHQLCEE